MKIRIAKVLSMYHASAGEYAASEGSLTVGTYIITHPEDYEYLYSPKDAQTEAFFTLQARGLIPDWVEYWELDAWLEDNPYRVSDVLKALDEYVNANFEEVEFVEVEIGQAEVDSWPRLGLKKYVKK